jgi:hypothetical protein
VNLIATKNIRHLADPGPPVRPIRCERLHAEVEGSLLWLCKKSLTTTSQVSSLEMGTGLSPSRSTTSRAREAYGANWPRLVELKRRYDPGNLFRLDSNIVP